MAESGSPNAVHKYWRQTTLRFADGEEIEMVLNDQTIKQLEEGDNDLMEKIRQQHRLTYPVTVSTPDTPPNTPQQTSSSSSESALQTSSSSSAHMDKERKLPKVWTTDETRLLFHTRMELEEDFNSMKTHKCLWGKIAVVMVKAGYAATSQQCENKFKSLKREYRATVDHNSKSGNGPKTCPFFEDFNETYGMKASTVLTFTLSSNESESTDVDIIIETDVGRTKKPKKRRAPSEALPHWLCSFEKRQVEYQEQKMKAMQDMHQDKMAVMERFLVVMEKTNKDNK